MNPIRGLAFAGVILCLLGGKSALAAPEQLCNELGSACVCSEPLNAAQPVRSGFLNPIDSPAGKQCNGGNAVDLARGGATVSAFGMPSGSNVSTVWQVNYSGSSSIAQLYGDSLTLNGGTVCTRIYQRLSSDYPLMGGSSDPGNERNKLMEMGGPWGQFQTQFWWPGPDAQFNSHVSSTTLGYDSNFPSSGGRVTVPDCKNSWCRMEQCLDHDGSRITARTRATVVNTGESQTLVSGRINAQGSLYIERMWIGNLYREEVTAGKRFISHGMQAFWSSPQPGRWIGAAYEVEGDNNGNFPDPAPPPPPDPEPNPNPNPPPSPGAGLQVSVSVAGGTATVQSSFGGSGPYQFLFDCGENGNWEGVVNTSQGSASYACPTSSGTVHASVWDQGSGAVENRIVVLANSGPAPEPELGPPGTPVIVD